MLQELAAAARWFDSPRELRVVAVSGAGRAFSAGADLRAVTIAQVHGFAVGDTLLG
jgi:enoyl-CoA hydratase/carnithine racemase